MINVNVPYNKTPEFHKNFKLSNLITRQITNSLAAIYEKMFKTSDSIKNMNINE